MSALPEIIDRELPMVQQSDTATIMHAITVAAADPQTDVAKMERMVELYKDMRAEQAKATYAQALTQFGNHRRTIPTNRTGEGPGGSSYAYADWPQMETSIRPWLSACGLSLTHRQDAPVIEGGKVALIMVYAILRHSDGHSEEASFPAIPNPLVAGKLSPSQLIQQAITYAKRQTAAMILGLSTQEDKDCDDVHGADQGPKEPRVTTVELGEVMKAYEASDGVTLFLLSRRDQQGYGRAWSRLNMKQKAACRELEQQGATAVFEYTTSLETMAESDDPIGAKQLIAEMTNPTMKQTVWNNLSDNARAYIQSLKEAA